MVAIRSREDDDAEFHLRDLFLSLARKKSRLRDIADGSHNWIRKAGLRRYQATYHRKAMPWPRDHQAVEAALSGRKSCLQIRPHRHELSLAAAIVATKVPCASRDS